MENGASALRLAKAYLKRRGAEEAGRLRKQIFDLENLRVLSWAGLVKLVWLTMWTYRLQTRVDYWPEEKVGKVEKTPSCSGLPGVI